MFFAEGVRLGFASLFATHPPLGERIRRLDPQWDGKFPPRLPTDMAADAMEGAAAGLVGAARASAPPVAAQTVQRGADLVGNPTAAHRHYAQQLIAGLPPVVAAAVREPYGARAVIYALLVDRKPDVRAVQLQALEAQALPDVYQLTQRLLPEMDALDARARLPLVDMAMPALRAMSRPQYDVFVGCFEKLVEADHRIDLFEWVLQQMLMRHLRPQFEPVKPTRVYYYGLQRLGEPCSVLLSVLAHAGARGGSPPGGVRQRGAHVARNVAQVAAAQRVRPGQAAQGTAAACASGAEAAGAADRRLRSLDLRRRPRCASRKRSYCARFATCSTAPCRHCCPAKRSLLPSPPSASKATPDGHTMSDQPTSSEFRPSASLEVLAARSALLRKLREFFWARSFVEVENAAGGGRGDPRAAHRAAASRGLSPFLVAGR